MRALPLMILLLLGSARAAELYTWTDGKGVEHFSSKPPKSAEDKKKAKKHKTGTHRPPVAGPGAKAAPQSAAKAAPAAPAVELYATSWCGYCTKARAYLNERGIPFADYDIEKDPAAAARYQSYGGGGIPLARINGETVRGFAPELYDPLFKP